MARQRQLNRGFRKSPSNKGWSGIILPAPVVIPANSRTFLAALTLDNDGIDETVLRVVGGITIASDQAAANENQIGAFGLCVVTDAAAAIGVTALPDSVIDVGDDMWLQFQGFAQEFQFSSAVGMRPNFGIWYPFDSKAKRVVHSGSQLAVIVSNAHATHGLTISVVFRLLSMVRGT